MIELYRKVYTNKFETEIAYYFLISTRGVKKYYEVSYEWIGYTNYIYSKYSVELDSTIKGEGKIENDVYRYTSILFENIKAQRRLSILSKFVLYLISVTNNIAIYRIPKRVVYYHDGIEVQLSPNAFAKSTYDLIPKFKKIYK
jgi:hypothetical protein